MYGLDEPMIHIAFLLGTVRELVGGLRQTAKRIGVDLMDSLGRALRWRRLGRLIDNHWMPQGDSWLGWPFRATVHLSRMTGRVALWLPEGVAAW